MQSILSKLAAFGNSLQSPLLLAIRLFWGGSFFVTGIGKFTHIEKTIAYFESLGIPFATFSAFFVGSIETIGGACLFLGLFSRLASIPLMCIMIAVFMTAETEALHKIFSDPQNFVQREPFSFLFASLLVFVFGPKAISFDYWLWKKTEK
ncbi:MAG TPA: DoxX family protein [Chlamydiales bacterium]|nr:DoxX family protein [Chlamydiales bacterium]